MHHVTATGWTAHILTAEGVERRALDVTLMPNGELYEALLVGGHQGQPIDVAGNVDEWVDTDLYVISVDPPA